MKLTLDRENLRPEHYFRDVTKIDFRHFNEEAMKAIIAANGAIFRHNFGHAIEIKIKFPPKNK